MRFKLIFKRHFPLLLLLFISVNTWASSPVSVLFIGNSFTENYDVPGMFDSLARHAGLPVYTGKFLRLGQSVSYFVNNDSCFNLIKSRDWNFIVFQDNQSNYVDTTGKIPEDIISLNLKFQDSIKKLLPCTHIIYTACWEKKGGFPMRFPGDNTERLYKRILANYIWLNSRPGMHNIIAPVGMAWLRLMKELPEYDPYNSADNRHPSLIGAYIFANTIGKLIFMDKWTRTDYRNVFMPDVAQTIRKQVFYAVMDASTYSNADVLVLSVSSDGGKLVAKKGFAKYQWYCGNKVLPGETKNTLRFGKGKKTYHLVVWNKNGCMQQSDEITTEKHVE